jgi:hypothetical protein
MSRETMPGFVGMKLKETTFISWPFTPNYYSLVNILFNRILQLRDIIAGRVLVEW